MAVYSFSYEIALLLTKYAGHCANFVKKAVKFLKKDSFDIVTLFATMSEPLTKNLPFLVESSLQV